MVLRAEERQKLHALLRNCESDHQIESFRALRLAPCDLPKIDGNVAYVGFSTVS
jgi:hypothetical protein